MLCALAWEGGCPVTVSPQQILRRQPDRLTKRKNEPVTVGREAPLLLWTLLSRRYGPRPYRAAAEDLAIHPTVLRSIAPTPENPSSGHTRPGMASIHSIGR